MSKKNRRLQGSIISAGKAYVPPRRYKSQAVHSGDKFPARLLQYYKDLSQSLVIAMRGAPKFAAEATTALLCGSLLVLAAHIGSDYLPDPQNKTKSPMAHHAPQHKP